MLSLAALTILTACASTAGAGSRIRVGSALSTSEEGELPDAGRSSTAPSGAGGTSGAESPSASAAASVGIGDVAGPSGRVGTAAGAESKEEQVVHALLSAMSLEDRVGQLLMVAVEDPRTRRELPAVDAPFRDLFSRIRPGGVILFGANIVTIKQTIDLVGQLQALARVPLFVSTDEEGGLVSRLTSSGEIPATPVPSAWTIGEANDPQLAYRAGTVIGSELSALGINMDLAPDADVLTNPENRVIGTRSFGSNAAHVAAMVAAMVRGIQSQGVSAVIKHFPGHGDTKNDTHYRAAIVHHDRARLNAVELVPFERGIAAGVDGVMTAHIGLPEVTGSNMPATLSPQIVDGILRHDLGFQGVVLTDAMNMAALDNYSSPQEAVVAAILAGCDVILRPSSALVAFNAILDAVRSGRISEARLDRSVHRILLLKYRLGLLDGDRARPTVESAKAVLGSPEHRAVMKSIVEEAKRRPTRSDTTASR